MSGFDKAWAAVAVSRDGEPVSKDLHPLLQAVYVQVLSEPLREVELKASLENLLKFLVSDGRTNANCWAVDLFFGLCEGWEQDWGQQFLPENFHDILAMMGEALHDTVRRPEIAGEFGCLPEQLLERVRRLALD